MNIHQNLEYTPLPAEFVVGNMARRMLRLIREAYAQYGWRLRADWQMRESECES